MISLPKPLSTMVDIDQIPEVNQVYASALNGIDKILKDAKSGKALQRIRGDIGTLEYNDRAMAACILEREHEEITKALDSGRLSESMEEYCKLELKALSRVSNVLRGWA